jgi:steroid delta-isomerase-like uncharacterized protein
MGDGQTSSLVDHGVAAEMALAYVSAWNEHDGAAVRRLFEEGGTYVDPTLPGPLSGEAIEMMVAGLVAAFPDLRFSVEGISVDGDRVTLQWRMHGTNTGPLPGAPQPTGGRSSLPGVDVITIGAGGIASVVGYFDQKTFVEQLGLQAVVVPHDEWPVQFGYASRTDLGNTTVPGALTITWIEPRSEAEWAEVEMRGTAVVEALASEPGFIGFISTRTGVRGHTITAWTSPEAAESAIARSRLHRKAMARVLSGDLSARGFTSFWVPHRLNQQLAECPTCHARLRIDTGSTGASCTCGGQASISSYL